MRLLLVYPEIECSVTNTNTYSVPLGLGSIATYCKEKLGGSLDIKILDGSLISHKEQLKETNKFKPDITAISSTIASQRNGYSIAKLAKELGALVLFGGVNSTALWRNILSNRDFVDGVILYEGEIPLYLILKNFKKYKEKGSRIFRDIPNIAYRDNKGNIKSPDKIYVHSLKDLPDIDYSLFDLDRYFKRTKERGFGKAITYYAGKGCSKRSIMELEQSYSFEDYNALACSMKTCTFCGRNEVGLRNFDEKREAKIVKELNKKYGVTGFFNVQDIVNLKNKSPIKLENCWFRLFLGLENVTAENIKILKQRYGSHLIFQVGIESASPAMRKNYDKPITDPEDIFKKVELMKKEGIQLHASFILGGRGETLESMKETSEVAKKLVDYNNTTWILISPQLILPGSPDYNALLQMPNMDQKYRHEDLIDIVEINEDFLKYFAPSITRERILDSIKDTFNDIRKKRDDVVLDVKGVVEDEEEYIEPGRPYSEQIKLNGGK